MKYDSSKTEFEQFLNAHVEPPPELTQKVCECIMCDCKSYECVKPDANPKASRVFAKLVLIHVFVGLISLFGCPQFGITPTGGLGLMLWFRKLGDPMCAALCGSFFFVGTILVAWLVMLPEEFKLLRRAKWAQFVPIVLISEVVFLLGGSNLAWTWFVFWSLGAVATAIGGTEIIAKFRYE